MIRRLLPGDFNELWRLSQAYIDRRLRPDEDRAREHYQALLSRGCLAEGEYEGDRLVGAIIVRPEMNAYAQKGHAGVELWIGSMALLDRAIAWWDGRPLLRAMHITFPCDVRPGLGRALKMRGFERNGDMNMLWR